MATLVVGTAAARAITILVSPLLTRLYSPEDFGILAVYVGIVSIVAVVAGLTYDLAIPLPQDDEDAFSLLVLSLGIAAFTAFIVMLVLLWIGPRLLNTLQADGLVTMWGAIPVGILAASVYNAFSYWAVRVQDYKRLARTKVSQGIGMAVAQVGLGIVGTGPIGLIAGDVIGRSSGSATLGGLALRTQARCRPSVRRLSALARRYRRFPLFSMPASFLNTAGLYAPAIILSATYGSVTAGWFALAQRVAGLGVVFIGHAVGQAYLGEATRVVRDNPEQLRNLFLVTITRLASVSLVIFSVLFLTADWFFATVFGSQWQPSGVFVRMMIPFLFLQLIAAPVSQTLNILEKQSSQFAWEVLRLALGLGSMVMVFIVGGSAEKMILMYAIGMSVAYILLLALIYMSITRKMNG